MLPFLGINYNAEEIPVENSNNVYRDDEFQLKLPKGIGLVSLPKMFWTRVKHFLPPITRFQTFFSCLQK